MKQDWISGEIDIPRFHCPRCRDHWYGLTTVPCDEELARLIREGLWRTGNDGTEASQATNQRERSLKSVKGSGREIQPLESGSVTKLPSIKKGQFSLSKTNAGNSSWHLKQQGVKDSKKKKKITFELEDSEDGGGYVDTQEQGGEAFHGAGRSTGKDGHSVEGGEGTAGSGDDRRAVRGGARCEGGSGGGDGAGLVGGDGRETTGNVHSGGTGQGGGETGSGGRGDSRIGDGDGGLSGGRNARDGKLNGGDTSGRRTALGEGKEVGLGAGLGAGSVAGSRSRAGEEAGSYGGATGTTGRGCGGSSGQPSNSAAISSQREEEEGGSVTQLDSNRSGVWSNSRKIGGTSSGGRAGGGDSSFLKPTDHGKRIRKSGGYMRAVSPTSSEWGDPLHARSFISSTAASQMGSASDLTEASEITEPDGGGGNHSNRILLPPIIHPIPPQAVNIDFMAGPSITRAWTFSYH